MRNIYRITYKEQIPFQGLFNRSLLVISESYREAFRRFEKYKDEYYKEGSLVIKKLEEII